MCAPSEYTAVTEFLYGQKPRGRNFGVDRMRKLAAALGHPERLTPAIHIAGTNGKGSVAAMVESILRAAGWRTGLFTSPHLVHLGERVQVSRERLGEAEIIDYVRELRPIADQLAEANPEDRPSFFEYLTAMACLQFARRHCDIAIMEVGLGGRLDATNILTPEVSVITSIAKDHEELLGHELDQIAAEKAGIIKPGRPVVVGRMPPLAERRIRAIAAELNAPLVSVREKYGEEVAGCPQTNLEGDYQRWNAATAAETVRLLADRWRITDEVIALGLAHVEWAGRWQRVRLGGRLVILDASHNPEGAQSLDANLARLRVETGRAPIVIAGVLGLARARPLIEVICRHASEVRLVPPHQPRACTGAELESAVPAGFRGRVRHDTVENLFPAPGDCTAGGPDDVVVVTGSIYLLGEVMTRLHEPGSKR
jgi:dihydrofolate synthase/folylpolyglutamate synthase